MSEDLKLRLGTDVFKASAGHFESRYHPHEM
jgi:hypothetical protein